MLISSPSVLDLFLEFYLIFYIIMNWMISSYTNRHIFAYFVFWFWFFWNLIDHDFAIPGEKKNKRVFPFTFTDESMESSYSLNSNILTNENLSSLALVNVLLQRNAFLLIYLETVPGASRIHTVYDNKNSSMNYFKELWLWVCIQDLG